MKHLSQYVCKHIFVYILVLSVSLMLPVALKLVATGSLGPATLFYYYVGWVPMAALIVSALRGKDSILIMGIALLAVFIWTLLQYPPAEAMMDFRRQFIYEAQMPIIFGLILGIVLQLLLSRFGSPKMLDK